MDTFLRALCLCLAIEGLIFALAPRLARKALEEASARSDGELRMLGATALAASALMAWFLR